MNSDDIIKELERIQNDSLAYGLSEQAYDEIEELIKKLDKEDCKKESKKNLEGVTDEQGFLDVKMKY